MITRLVLTTACTFGIMTGAALAQSTTPPANTTMPAKPMASPMAMPMKHHHHWMASNGKHHSMMAPSDADHSADQLNAQELTKGAS